MQWWWRRLPVLSMVVVNLKHEGSVPLRGVLVSSRGPWLTLRDTWLLAAAGETFIDGDVLVPRDNVAFVQVPPPRRAS